MYWAMIFISASKGGYSHHPIVPRRSFIPAKQWATLWWNPPMVRPILGLIPQVSDPNKRVAWMNAL